jgi:hypothetical protein
VGLRLDTPAGEADGNKDSWEVPWMLAPSGPILKLTHAEETSVCHVAAHVFFGPLKNFEEDPENPGCRRIRIDFEMGLWSKFSPAYSERETVRKEDFDWSQVPFSEPVTDTGRYLREFEAWWRERGDWKYSF